MLIPLTQRDESKLDSLLRRPYLASQPSWQKEVRAPIEGSLDCEMAVNIAPGDHCSPAFHCAVCVLCLVADGPDATEQSKS